MDVLIRVLTVLMLAAVEIWVAIPTGFALRLHPVAIGVAAAMGGALGALVIVLLGDGVRAWLLRRLKVRGGGAEHGRLYRVWVRYGVAGLGLVAPLLMGAPLGTALGLLLGAPAGRLLLWMIVGILVWSTALTLSGSLGLAVFKAAH